MKLAIYFDLDGTISDSAPGITNALRYLQEKERLRELSRAEQFSCLGPPLAGSFMRLWHVDEPFAEHLLDVYREYYNNIGIFENTLYPGIKELLQSLQAQHIECRVCSAKPEIMVHRVLDHFGIKPYFSQIRGAQLHGTFPGKGALLKAQLALDPAKALMLGDRRDDFSGARQAGIGFIGALWGYGSREEFAAVGDAPMAETPADVLPIALELLR